MSRGVRTRLPSRDGLRRTAAGFSVLPARRPKTSRPANLLDEARRRSTEPQLAQGGERELGERIRGGRRELAAQPRGRAGSRTGAAAPTSSAGRSAGRHQLLEPGRERRRRELGEHRLSRCAGTAR